MTWALAPTVTVDHSVTNGAQRQFARPLCFVATYAFNVMYVAGLDGCKNGWVAIVLDDGEFAEGRYFGKAMHAITAWPDTKVIAIDIPIGLPDASTGYLRDADLAARRFLGRAASSVFPTLPHEVLAEATFAEALARSQELLGRGISRQSYGLRAKIAEIGELVESEPRVFEVHPEVSFREMAKGRILNGKKTWNGLIQRKKNLESVGITMPDSLMEAPKAGADDVLDAAAAAWSAMRIATGQARTLPERPWVNANGRPVAIYY